MDIFCLPFGFLITIPILIAIACSLVFLWQYRPWHLGMTFSDKQIVFILVSLLIIAVISIGMFLLIGFNKLGSWWYVCL